MNYTKPEIEVLGKAVCVIEQFPQIKALGTVAEFPKVGHINPAYDLDE